MKTARKREDDSDRVVLVLSRAEYQDLKNCLSEYRDIMTFINIMDEKGHKQGRDLFSEMAAARDQILLGETP